MSAIDVQNAKQIRDPMDVLITLSLGTDIAMTYSGYSSAKVADGVLNQSSWPMRGLADLQGNGFPLDGSRVLYNPSTSPSQTNGKLGVRGNVGQPVSVTATGEEAIAALAISVTGAASVTLNGETTEITGSHVTLQLLNTTAALTFQPSSEDRRVEIITVLPEADFVINNDNLIKATVSLRSDLSIIDPTLPESELNVEVYQDLDVSEVVASIPEDTPITYQAGYPGDMSPVRKFYVSGQITWADNVLKIQAVDAVHFLEVGIGSALTLNAFGYIDGLAGAAMGFVNKYVGAYFERPFLRVQGKGIFIVDRGLTAREFIADVNNMMHQANDMWYTYVDAGAPNYTLSKPQSGFVINEEDCASYRRIVERKISTLSLTHRTFIENSSTEGEGNTSLGTATFIKNVGVSLSFEGDYVNLISIGLLEGTLEYDKYYESAGPIGGTLYGVLPLIPVDSNGKSLAAGSNVLIFGTDGRFGYQGMRRLLGDGIPQSDYYRYPENWTSVGVPYTQFIPWGASYDPSDFYWNNNLEGVRLRSQSDAWRFLVQRGVISSQAAQCELRIGGTSYKETSRVITYSIGQDGKEEAVDNSAWIGEMTRKATGENVYPKGAYESLLKRSNVTCSFTWKGDPRIQPRDVFTFHRLDGTDEEWTFENITITHEGGGTLAEITARKGIV